jgi:hypothetical protein
VLEKEHRPNILPVTLAAQKTKIRIVLAQSLWEEKVLETLS